MKKKIFSLLILITICAICSCSNVTTARFAVISDTHIYDEDILGNNSALTTYMAWDDKMLLESSDILDAVISDLETQSLDFILVSGDMTKDGEKIDHQLFVTKMNVLKNAGIKIYIVPGNHDINNPDALNYTNPDGTTTPAEQVTPSEFKTIYADFGYKSALYQDPDSLSYIVEPVSGVWLFAIDSCIYNSNVANGAPTTAGQISDASLAWITSKLSEAKQKGKLVIGMEHHGIAEHYTSEATLFPDFVLTNYAAVGKQLADDGLNIMFTGHFHANDITMSDFTSSKIYDVETGSLVTAPSPYRLIDLDIPGKTFNIESKTVQAIASHPADFVSYAHNFLVPQITNITTSMLAPYNLDSTTSSIVIPLLVQGMAAHYAGDENMITYNLDSTVTSGELLFYYGIIAIAASGNASAQMLLDYINAVWTDLDPADNNVTITLD